MFLITKMLVTQIIQIDGKKLQHLLFVILIDDVFRSEPTRSELGRAAMTKIPKFLI